MLLFYSSVFYLGNVFNPNCSSKSIAGFNIISLRPFKYEPYPGEIGQHEFGIAPIHAYNFVGFDLRVFNAAVNVFFYSNLTDYLTVIKQLNYTYMYMYLFKVRLATGPSNRYLHVTEVLRIFT